jgi:hypothetical protein
MVISAEQKCLDALKTVAKLYPEYDCLSIGSYAECAVCIERTEKGWEVYQGEHMKHHNSEIYSDIITACLSVIDRIGYPEDTRQVKERYIQEITNTSQYAAVV